MPTRTAEKSALAELEALKDTRAERQSEARAARARIDEYEAQRIAAGLVRTEVPADLDEDRAAKRDLFHAADVAVTAFRIRNAAALLDQLVPDRGQVAGEVADAVDRLLSAIDRYRDLERDMLAALDELGLSGQDMVSDPRVNGLADALGAFRELDPKAPFSRSIETPEGSTPLFRVNDDDNPTGWVR